MPNWSRFDMTAALLFSKKHRNADMLARECSRVGLSFTPFWGCCWPYAKVLERSIPHTKNCVGGRMDCSLNHARIVRVAYETGARSVLILEDDVRFLKDVSLLRRIVQALPEDYDVALLDWFLHGGYTEAEADALMSAPRANGYWARFDNDLRSCACWALSRKGMEAWLAHQESALYGGGAMLVCDQYFSRMAHHDRTLKLYCAFPCCAEQGACGGITAPEKQQSRYVRMGMKREDYAEDIV